MSGHGRSGQVRPGRVKVRPCQVRSDNDKVWSGQDRSRQLRKVSGQVMSDQEKVRPGKGQDNFKPGQVM